MDVFKLIAAGIAGYMIGSLNTGVLVGKLYGKDIREHGSKGAGLTNTLRVLGKTAAVLVLLGDVLKGVVACLLGYAFSVYSNGAPDCVSALTAGVCVVVGHNWPVYFGFRGGKGALTALAVLFVADWLMALCCLVLFVSLVALSRYVSLGSICAAVLFAVLSFVPFFGHGLYFSAFACIIAGIVIFQHRGNIKRLLSGTENKLSFHKTAKP